MTYDQSRAMAHTLNTPEMAMYDPSAIRLMAMHQKTLIHTAYRGVPVQRLMMVQTFEKGMSLSREKAKTVRASACVAVQQTNWRMRKAETVK